MNVAKADILDAIANMTVLELSQLIKDMEEKFGVSAAAAHGAVQVGLLADLQAGLPGGLGERQELAHGALGGGSRSLESSSRSPAIVSTRYAPHQWTTK